MNITKTFLTTRDDIIKFYFGNRRFNLGIPYMLLAAMIVITGIAQTFAAPDYGTILFIVVGATVLSVFTISPYVMSKKIITQNVFFQHDITVDISPEGIRQDAYNSTAFFKWDEAFDFFENKHTIAVFISQYQAYILPKRVFAEEELTAVSQLLRGSIVSKRKKWHKTCMSIVLWLIIVILAGTQLFSLIQWMLPGMIII